MLIGFMMIALLIFLHLFIIVDTLLNLTSLGGFNGFRKVHLILFSEVYAYEELGHVAYKYLLDFLIALELLGHNCYTVRFLRD